MILNKCSRRYTASSRKTVERLIKTAEELFANEGFFAVSIRDITQKAEANSAAVHYHFGSKEELFLEVLNRHIVPFINQFVTKLKSITEDKALEPEDIVYAYLSIMKQLIAENETGAVMFSRLVSRLMLEEYKIFRRDLLRLYEDASSEIFSIVEKAFPNLEQETIHWRVHIALTTLFNTFAGNDVLRTIMPTKIVQVRDPQVIEHYVVPFVIAGLKV